MNRGDLDGAVEDAAQDFEYIPLGTIPGTAAVYRGLTYLLDAAAQGRSGRVGIASVHERE